MLTEKEKAMGKKIVRVYFTNGNIKMYAARNMLDLFETLPYTLGAKCEKIYKIEFQNDQVEWEDDII